MTKIIINSYKNAMDFLEKHSKRFFLIKKINCYKKKLQYYKRFSFMSIIKYEKFWRHLRKKYKEIILYGIEFVSIGETIPRLFNLIEDMYKENKKSLYVVLPTFFDYYSGGIYNQRMFDLFGKKIHFIKDSNIDFWTFSIIFHINDINCRQFDKYASPRLGGIKVSLNKPLLPFSEKEIIEGENKLRNMGVNKEFICLHARESNVKRETFSKGDGYITRCRNCDINSFIDASRYFASINIQSVRLGKYEAKKCDEETVIDYSNLYYDEFMDFYLISRCKFMIGCDSGLSTICGYWGRPILLTNMVSICYGGENFPDTGYVMYIPKKIYSRKEKKYLNLYEMLDIMDECESNIFNYIKKGMVLEDNTREEILEAAIELNIRIDGLWIETEEELEHYNKYWEIMHKWNLEHKEVKQRKQGGFEGYTMFFGRLSYSYLKNNLYMLDL